MRSSHTQWHLGYPAQGVSAAERHRVLSSHASNWKAVKTSVLSEYRAIQAHVRRCGFDFAERLYVNNLYPEQHVLPPAMLVHNIEWIAEGASRFINTQRGAATPFFLFIGWTLPHNPEVLTSLQADPRYTPGGLWNANRSHVLATRERVCRLANVSTEALLAMAEPQPRRPQAVPMDEGVPMVSKFGHRHYPLALAWMDAGVGAVMSALRESHQEAQTLLVFTSDHAAFDKGHCYTGGSRVPLLLRWPAKLAPRLTPYPHPVSHLDLLPTFLHAANVPFYQQTPPAEPQPTAAVPASQRRLLMGADDGWYDDEEEAIEEMAAEEPQSAAVSSRAEDDAAAMMPEAVGLPSPPPAQKPTAAAAAGSDASASTPDATHPGAASAKQSHSPPPPPSARPPPRMSSDPLAEQLVGRSLADLLMGTADVAATPAATSAATATAAMGGTAERGVLGWQGAWAHGTPHERVLFCEVGQSRAVSTSRYRLIYAPRIKPIAKGGTTDPQHNYQANKHHAGYWRPLQMYDLAADPAEQRNLITTAERSALNLSKVEMRQLRGEIATLQRRLQSHLDEAEASRECSPLPPLPRPTR